jgi:hypothetical protein
MHWSIVMPELNVKFEVPIGSHGGQLASAKKYTL